MIPEEATDEQVRSLVDACPQAELSADDVRAVAAQLAEALEGLMTGVTGIYHPQSRLGKAVTALHAWRQIDGDVCDA